MEGLFFAVNQVWFIYPINYGFLLMSLIFTMTLFYYSIKHSNTIKKNPTIIDFNYIEPTDVNYNQKTLHSIREYVSKKYIPKHTWAHTNIDIKSYINNEKLLKIITTLEQIEYSGKKTTIDENTINNSQLALLLQ